MLAHLIAGVAGGYAFISLAEWYLHRYHMHRPGWFRYVYPALFHTHQKVHHPAYHAAMDAADPAGHADLGLEIDVVDTLRLLALPLLAVGYFLPVEAAVFALLAVLHGLTWNAVHTEMHAPRGRWFSKTVFFRYARDYHEVHHRHWDRNLNVVAFGADFLFGTYRKP